MRLFAAWTNTYVCATITRRGRSSATCTGRAHLAHTTQIRAPPPHAVADQEGGDNADVAATCQEGHERHAHGRRRRREKGGKSDGHGRVESR